MGEPSRRQRGLFIVVEGCDKAGKTQHVRRLLRELPHHLWRERFLYLNFPDRSTRIGHMLDDYLREKIDLDERAVHLLFSANRWEKTRELEAALRDGINVIADRYAFSGVAYSAAKGVPIEWCKKADSGLPRPDLICYLDVNAKVASKRAGGFGEERYERTAFQECVRMNFTLLSDGTWNTINTDHKTENAVFRELLSVIIRTIENGPTIQARKLWQP